VGVRVGVGVGVGVATELGDWLGNGVGAGEDVAVCAGLGLTVTSGAEPLPWQPLCKMVHKSTQAPPQDLAEKARSLTPESICRHIATH
jgi:hypothetical protein